MSRKRRLSAGRVEGRHSQKISPVPGADDIGSVEKVTVNESMYGWGLLSIYETVPLFILSRLGWVAQ